MFRLANFDDENIEEGGLYRYLSSAISQTIIVALDEFLENRKRYDVFYTMYIGWEFFSGLSRYIQPESNFKKYSNADIQVGYEFTFSKMKRMKEKMQDHDVNYTFDVFEEKILFFLCSIDAQRARTAEGRAKREPLKKKVEVAKQELREKYRLTARDANDFSRKMYYASAMLLKDSEDENLIFWDDDYELFWKDGFVKGIEYLKSFEGNNAGYGYHYTCNIFSDIGIKPPMMLLGTEEANRIANEVQAERFNEKMNDLFQEILSTDSIEDIKRKFGESSED